MGKTADKLSESELACYRKAAQERKKMKEAKLKERYTDALEIAQELSRVLYKEFHAQKVILFGSLTKQKLFHEYSDIDLAVVGMPAAMFYLSLTAVDNLSGDIKVDLIALEDCSPKLQNIITKEGVIL
jgi:predicted nucleotidyltransferase